MADIDLSKLTGTPVFQYYDPSAPAAGDMFWSMASSREGCYIANGADYAQADEPELYAAIGTAFNTQINPTTGSAWAAPAAGRFRVPDMRGVVPRGAGTPHNGSALAVGAYEADQMQGHRHSFNGWNDETSPAGTSRIGVNQNSNSEFLSTNDKITDPITDGTNGTPRTGSETRGKARGGNWFIRRFNPTPQVIGAGLATAVTPGLVSSEVTSLLVSTIGGATTSPSIGIRQTKVGRLVNLTLGPTGALTKNGSVGTIVAGVIDAPYRPTATTYIIAYNGQGAVLWRVSVDGSVEAYLTAGGTNIPAGQTGVGWGADVSLTYSIRH